MSFKEYFRHPNLDSSLQNELWVSRVTSWTSKEIWWILHFLFLVERCRHAASCWWYRKSHGRKTLSDRGNFCHVVIIHPEQLLILSIMPPSSGTNVFEDSPYGLETLMPARFFQSRSQYNVRASKKCKIRVWSEDNCPLLVLLPQFCVMWTHTYSRTQAFLRGGSKLLVWILMHWHCYLFIYSPSTQVWK